MIKTPIAYIIFNRPHHTRETFAVIRSLQPTKLYIIADGPRAGNLSDEARCKEVREVVQQIDWPCEVSRNYADGNLGLKKRVSSGLDWVFENEERAIVLEDDCLAHPDFFTFCDSLLDRYENDKRVWVITGNNFQNGIKRGNASYYFSKYNHCWGWATWRRAWKHYDGSLSFWPDWKCSKDWRHMMPDKIERGYWSSIFETVWQGKINSWGYPWTACVWYHTGLTATPQVNLVTNIGFGPDGTHTISKEDLDGIPTKSLGRLSHPSKIKQDYKADRFVADHNFGCLPQRIHRRLLRAPKSILKKVINFFKGGSPLC